MSHKEKIIPKIFNALNRKKIFCFLPDKVYLTLAFRVNIGRKLDLKNPKGYNDKLQWMKLYDRNDLYTQLVDKYKVKEYVSEKIGSEYIIPTLGIYNTFEEIDFSKLPNQFVMKCTHDSGGLVICKDKNKLDIEKARKKINKSLKRNYYKTNREWPYKNVERKIIVEKYMVDESKVELKDYKFFCFNGKVYYLFVGSNRAYDTKFDFYDREFRHLPIINGHDNSSKEFKKPDNFDKMIELAETLAKDIKNVRVDLYNINGKIYFGEFTFFHFSGFTKFEPEDWDFEFGKLMDLPIKKERENEVNN